VEQGSVEQQRERLASRRNRYARLLDVIDHPGIPIPCGLDLDAGDVDH